MSSSSSSSQVWMPPNLSSSCSMCTTISNCAPSTFLFLQLIQSLFGRPREDNQQQQYQQQQQQDIFANFRNSLAPEEFDFIVVGAGSGGCVVANRLSEVPEWRVLLLEAGIEEPEIVTVPGLAPALQRSSVDWGTNTQPSTGSCLARPQSSCPWVHGRVMGGTSCLNYMIYMRGNPLDFDEWDAHYGNPGWSYKDVFPYFLKSEDNQNIGVVDEAYHAQGGYQSVSIHAYQDRNIFPIIEAFKEIGLPEIDQNAGPQNGVMLVQGTVGNGRRVSTNDAFIRPIRNKRKNLVIRTNSNVIRVLINPKTKKAYGVQYMTNKTMTTVYARKEVIVSSGPINTPKVLMLSGIGPENHLRSRNVQVIKDLPVGKNLHDHTTLDGFVFDFNHSSTLVDNNQMNADIHYYRGTNRGPIATSALLQISAMLRTKYAEDERPEIQYLIDAANVANFFTDPILTSRTNVGPMAYYNGITVRPILLNPVSRGVVLLNDTDPINGGVMVYPNTFAERIDLLRIIDGIRQAEQLLLTESFSKLNVRLISNKLPACAHYEFDTDEYWECAIRGYTASVYHPAGTCKMGPEHDKTTVVDHELRVHGIKNLRVMDSSIMPRLIRGNTNAPTIMIAEMGTDFIKKTWKAGGQSDGYGGYLANDTPSTKYVESDSKKSSIFNYIWNMLKDTIKS